MWELLSDEYIRKETFYIKLYVRYRRLRVINLVVNGLNGVGKK